MPPHYKNGKKTGYEKMGDDAFLYPQSKDPEDSEDEMLRDFAKVNMKRESLKDAQRKDSIGDKGKDKGKVQSPKLKEKDGKEAQKDKSKKEKSQKKDKESSKEKDKDKKKKRKESLKSKQKKLDANDNDCGSDKNPESSSEDKDKTRHNSGSPTMHSSGSGFGDSFSGAAGLTTSHSSHEIGGGTRMWGDDSPVQRSHTPTQAELDAARPSTAGEEELQLQLALAMSKEEHDEEQKRRKTDEIKYQMAIEESKKQQDDEANPTTLLDLAAGGAAAPATDPWGVQQPPPASDPWAPPAPKPLQSAQNDPWGPGLAAPPQPAAPAPATDPWAPPPPQPTAAAAPADPWGSPANQPNTNGAAGGIDDEFDLLSSSRTKSPVTTSNGNGVSGDLLAGEGSNPWDMTNMGGALATNNLAQQREQERKNTKSPADFLGENAGLVNLENLVTPPAPPSTTNPFALTIGNTKQQASNPFHQPVQHVPINQMPNSSSSTSLGFNQPQGGAMLQSPLMPMGGAPPPMQTNQAGVNPFL